MRPPLYDRLERDLVEGRLAPLPLERSERDFAENAARARQAIIRMKRG